MDVKQVYDLVNEAQKQALGEKAIALVDLNGVVDVGTAIYNANAVDNYCHALLDRIGKTIFVDRAYKGRIPSLFMDEFEFGSVLQKVQGDLIDAEENESWELQDGVSVDQFVFHKPTISVKYFNAKQTFEVPLSVTEVQLKESFLSQSAMMSFVNMLFNLVDKSMTIKADRLAMFTIANFVGETIYADYQGNALSSKSGTRAINLLYLYNNSVNLGGTPLSVTKALYDKEFLKFASSTISLYITRMATMNTLFNIEGKERFTPRDYLHITMLSDFVAKCDSYLESETFHNNLVALPNNYDEVSCWQGVGTSFAFDDASKIMVTTSENHNVTATGLLAVLWDRDAMGILNKDKRVKSAVNSKGEYTNYFTKMDAHYFNDFQEQLLCFFIA